MSKGSGLFIQPGALSYILTSTGRWFASYKKNENVQTGNKDPIIADRRGGIPWVSPSRYFLVITMKRTKPVKPSVTNLTYDEALADFMTQLTHECHRVGPLAGVLKDEEEFVGMINMKIDKLEHQFMRRSFKADTDDEESYKKKTPKKRKRSQEDEMLRETALEIAAYGFAMYLHNREKVSKYMI